MRMSVVVAAMVGMCAGYYVKKNMKKIRKML